MNSETKLFNDEWNEGFERGLQMWDPVVEFCNEHAILKPVARWIETNQAQARGHQAQKKRSKFFDDNQLAHALTVMVLEMYPPVMLYDYVNKYYRPEQGILGHDLAEAAYKFYMNQSANLKVVK